ncbi:MAG: hypothetical protein M3Q39_11215 [Actinomycetota bacterium]|nr:hypothetical protein [Actinomycetota bacterium]
MGDSRIEKLATNVLADDAAAAREVRTTTTGEVMVFVSNTRTREPDLARWALQAAEALRLARISLNPCRCRPTRWRHTSTKPTPCAPCRVMAAVDDLLTKEPT